MDPSERTVQISPNSNSTDEFVFQVTSNNPAEYVHLESCALSLIDESGQAVIGADGKSSYEFLKDGCLTQSKMRSQFDMVDYPGRFWFLKQIF